MNSMKKYLTLAAALTLSTGAVFAGATSLGETASARASVRANGMGDAYTAANGDVFGFYYNPAQTAPKSAGFSFGRGYSEDTTSIIGAYFPGLFGGVNVGASFLFYTLGDMDLYGPNGKIGTVNAEHDYMGTVNLSKEIGVLSFGVNAKVLRTTLFEATSAAAFLLDGGFKARLPWVDLGASVQNIGEEMTLGNEDERIPRTVRFGAYRGFESGKTGINLAADMVKTEQENTYFCAGAEFVYNKMLALRTGYEFQNSLSEANLLRFGFGVKVSEFTLDYALVPYKDLGSTHRFAVAYAFGVPAAASAMPSSAQPTSAAPAAEQPAAVPSAEQPISAAPAAEQPAPVMPAAEEVVAPAPAVPTAPSSEQPTPAESAVEPETAVPAQEAPTPVEPAAATPAPVEVIPAQPDPVPVVPGN